MPLIARILVCVSVAFSVFGLAFAIAGEPIAPYPSFGAELAARAAVLVYAVAISAVCLFIAYAFAEPARRRRRRTYRRAARITERYRVK